MTFRQIVSAMLRRWYVPLAILACTALVTVMLARDGGIYTTRTLVSLMHPTGTSLSPDNGTSDSSVIAFAASVLLEVNNSRPPAGYSMADAPYYGAGIREGVLVELANSGNQWVSTVSKAEIEIDIAGRSLDWVEAQQQQTVERVLRIADSQQAIVGIPPERRIEASVVPLTSQIDYIAPSRRTQLTAWAAMAAVTIILSAWGSVVIDGMLLKRKTSKTNVWALSSLGREGLTS